MSQGFLGLSSKSSFTILQEDTELYVWGNNKHGQLGLGHHRNESTPQPLGNAEVSPVNLGHIIAIAFGWAHSLVLTKVGLFVWGNNRNGQLGLGHWTKRDTPEKLTVFDPEDVISMHCGLDHTMVLTKNGLFVWGHNGHGQLGLGHQNHQNSPQKLTVFDVKDIISVDCGCHHSMVLTKNGLFVWGKNSEGQLGLGHLVSLNAPQKHNVFNSDDILNIACGYSHSMILTKNGLFTWGRNIRGQLGLGTQRNHNSPQKIHSLNVDDIIGIACGNSHSMAFTKNGLFLWGRNEEGQLGLGHSNDITAPQKIPEFEVSDIITFGCGWAHSFVLTKSGLYMWGYNNCGQLGLGHDLNQSLPQKVSGLPPGNYHWSYWSPPQQPAILHLDEPDLLSFLSDLLKSGDYSDLEITIQNRLFRLHRAIVATRCPKLLTSSQSYDTTTSEAFYLLCRFIYSNHFSPNIPSETLIHLSSLSSKVGPEELEILCEQSIVSSFTRDNVFDIILLCAKFELHQLVDYGIQFVGKNHIHPPRGILTQLKLYPGVLRKLNQKVAKLNTPTPQFLKRFIPLLRAIETLYTTKIESDFTIQVHGKSLQVHKCILGPKWDYFARIMLKESKHYTEMPLSTFEKLIHYFYSNNNKEFTLSDCGWLISFSGYYGLEQKLINLCDNIVNSKINASNWQEALNLGVKLDSNDLKERAMTVVPYHQLFIYFFDKIQQLQLEGKSSVEKLQKKEDDVPESPKKEEKAQPSPKEEQQQDQGDENKQEILVASQELQVQSIEPLTQISWLEEENVEKGAPHPSLEQQVQSIEPLTQISWLEEENVEKEIPHPSLEQQVQSIEPLTQISCLKEENVEKGAPHPCLEEQLIQIRLQNMHLEQNSQITDQQVQIEQLRSQVKQQQGQIGDQQSQMNTLQSQMNTLQSQMNMLLFQINHQKSLITELQSQIEHQKV